MTTTFTFATRDDAGAVSIGLLHDHVCPDPSTCDDAQMYGDRCCDHVDDLVAACGCQDFDVNVSNVNAVAVFAALGIDHDYVGVLDPDDLLGSALLATLVDHDPILVTCPLGGPTIAHARPDHLVRLADLATAAKARGHLVGFA